MNDLSEIQAAFRSALEGSGDHQVARLIAEPAHGPGITTRLNIYRNNIVCALIRSLEGLYPSLVRLMGKAFFDRVARDFVKTNPPAHGRLVEYGSEFPDFVAGYAAAASHAWFPDVARLELAWHRAYVAAEAPLLDIRDLEGVAPEHMSAIELVVHPSCQWLESMFPVSGIWKAGLEASEARSTIEVTGGPERLLVVRPESEVEVRTLDEAGYRFGRLVSLGADLGTAWEAASSVDSKFDLQRQLGGLFAGGTFSGYRLAASG